MFNFFGIKNLKQCTLLWEHYLKVVIEYFNSTKQITHPTLYIILQKKIAESL
jgi:hypothetical protein